MDELLNWREEFPILDRSTYLISNSLGAMPRAVYDRLHEYADGWATRGVRQWEEGWWDMAVGVGDRILVDGAATNPLPFDLLAGVADLIVAVDIFGASAATRSDTPGVWESLTTTLNIMGSTIAAAKQKHIAPDLVIRPNVATFSSLDFYQASAILRAAEPAKGDVKQKLGALLA